MDEARDRLEQLRNSKPLQWGRYSEVGDRLCKGGDTGVRIPLGELVLQGQERPTRAARGASGMTFCVCLLVQLFKFLAPFAVRPVGQVAVAVEASYNWALICELKTEITLNDTRLS